LVNELLMRGWGSNKQAIIRTRSAVAPLLVRCHFTVKTDKLFAPCVMKRGWEIS
jgi:hypothetical protein